MVCRRRRTTGGGGRRGSEEEEEEWQAVADEAMSPFLPRQSRGVIVPPLVPIAAPGGVVGGPVSGNEVMPLMLSLLPLRVSPLPSARVSLAGGGEERGDDLPARPNGQESCSAGGGRTVCRSESAAGSGDTAWMGDGGWGSATAVSAAATASGPAALAGDRIIQVPESVKVHGLASHGWSDP